MKRAAAALAALVLFAAAPAVFAADMLVSPAWLLAHQNDKNLVLLHVGVPAEFEREHIPRARLVNPQDLSIPRTEGALLLQLLPPDQLREKLESYGIGDGSRVVVYFAKDWVSPTTRVYFSLDAAGLGDRTSVLDGGMPAWADAGGVVTAELAPPPAKGTITAKPRPDLVADLDYVEAHLASPGVAIVDARDPRFYDGADPGAMPRAGHIPGAKSLPFDTLVADDNTMKSPADTEALFKTAGVRPGDTVVSYCHIGQQATVVFFAAKRLGYKALLYDGSWDEWSRRPDLPAEKGAKPAP
ncbi:MAG TPA: rhodanese-like domain-containing protein [Thermoanaerobaculia bacterium]|nr:rhodanese-like domain-containing protein [Thermoanaerobaculia bacterium]